ncbi:MAG TPA: gamma-glutamyl-gamma-aminobutyrate hydrolase family protein [Burkholderiaceae bacterium]|nr:gamma-glutamyl-gamma-aminobutyrate hydrolase family protein [Burkholderiaceae bacterium]
MQNRPLKIGLSARLLHTPPKEMGFRNKTLQYLEQTIAHWIMAHGAMALMIPTIGSSAEVSRRGISVRSYVRELDGLVLQGGADVCPRSYGKQPMRAEWAGDIVRDRYEMELIHEFVAQRKPVLGICRGAQLLNVAFGGTLYQDIPTLCPGAIPHVDAELYDALHHEIRFEPGSRLGALYDGLSGGLVNSIHPQAVYRLGGDLVVDARSSADGIVEAIRWRGSGYAVGLQWHPEFHGGVQELLDSAPIMLDFLEAARRMRDEQG